MSTPGLRVCLGLLAASLLLAGCQGLPEDRPSPEAGAKLLYLVSHGWHAGLVLRRGDVSDAIWPDQHDFPEATYLEVGWGDSAYYRTPKPSLEMLLKAGLTPTPSVLHVVGFSRPVASYFPRNEIIELSISQQGLDSLAAFIWDAYDRDAEGQPQPLGPGLYGESVFYAGRDHYHLFRNCNTWVAHALQAAGFPIHSGEVLTVGDLLRWARHFGTPLHSDG